FALFILCVIDGFSANQMLQNEEFKQHTVRGVVKDLITKRPIPYANVYLPDGTAGTVTNEEGLFTIKVKSSSEMVVVDLQERPRADVQRNLPARERPFEKSQIFDDTAEQNWDRDFWREYNIIEPTESLERAVEKLKRIYFAK
ncbi:MAG: carboxypeptidase-like regulatory domain-containing protein, partial [Candidatus Egerieousia sp.]|nr:carboxypeptidase-like regulatory domain-containing protein [Candidatus Egerieousia sp.]